MYQSEATLTVLYEEGTPDPKLRQVWASFVSLRRWQANVFGHPGDAILEYGYTGDVNTAQGTDYGLPQLLCHEHIFFQDGYTDEELIRQAIAAYDKMSAEVARLENEHR